MVALWFYRQTISSDCQQPCPAGFAPNPATLPCVHLANPQACQACSQPRACAPAVTPSTLFFLQMPQ